MSYDSVFSVSVKTYEPGHIVWAIEQNTVQDRVATENLKLKNQSFIRVFQGILVFFSEKFKEKNQSFAGYSPWGFKKNQSFFRLFERYTVCR